MHISGLGSANTSHLCSICHIHGSKLDSGAGLELPGCSPGSCDSTELCFFFSFYATDAICRAMNQSLANSGGCILDSVVFPFRRVLIPARGEARGKSSTFYAASYITAPNQRESQVA